MKARDHLRVLLLGGDASVHVALSMAVGNRASQIVAPPLPDATIVREMARDADVVVVVTRSATGGPSAALRIVQGANVQAKTLVLGGEEAAPAHAIAIGAAGYLREGASSRHLRRALEQIAGGGAFFDAPAAQLLGNDPEATSGGLMSAARALASALELKDSYTGGHAERVSSLALRLAEAALGTPLVKGEILEAAFLLHDVGKIGIPESILIKPAGLTVAERSVLETHPILGETIIAPLGFPPEVRHVVRHHHERWDGTGYPDALLGPEIPIEARIFAIADVVDAMSSIRPYRRPVRFEEAVAEVVRGAGSHFDPELARLAEDIFLRTPVEV